MVDWYQMAALRVLRQVGKVADADFLAMEVLPILWTFALGPLLDLQQFQSFMGLIKSLSTHIEREQTKKLQESTSSNGVPASRAAGKQGAWAPTTNTTDQAGGEVDFESLVSGNKANNGNTDILSDWGPPAMVSAGASQALPKPQVTKSNFSWSTADTSKAIPPPRSAGQMNALKASSFGTSRTVTPDQSLNSSFTPLQPGNPFSQPLQPLQPSQPSNISLRPMQMSSMGGAPSSAFSSSTAAPSINWSAATTNNNPGAVSWGTQRPPTQTTPSFSIAPPPKAPFYPQQNGSSHSNYTIAAPPPPTSQQPGQPAQKTGLDQYASLL